MQNEKKSIFEKNNDENKKEEKLKFKSKHKVIFLIFNILFQTGLYSLIAYILVEQIYKIFDKANPFTKLAYKLSIAVPNSISGIVFIVSIIFFVISAILFFIFLLPPGFDLWIKDISNKRLGSSFILYDRKLLYIDYDVSLKNQDIKDFISEMSAKSKNFTYYLVEIVIDEHMVIVAPEKKKDIPKRCVLENKNDTAWNIIPLGEAVNNELKNITPIGWWLNDNEVRKDMIKTLPSTSLMIAGGTGSGKSVVENGIIGHITRFPDKIQGLLIDVKKVEFGGLQSYMGIKKVGISIEDCDSIITQARTIMYDRFTFMEQQGVNNVYKLEGEGEVDFFIINGKPFQFDEIFDCKIDGSYKLLTANKLFEEIQNENFIEIVDPNYKGLTKLTKKNIIKTKGIFKPKAILILIDELGEVMNDSNYRVVSSIQANLGSIARLGRAAGVHLCLATQRPSGDVINSDLKNNIQMGVLLGDFDSSASSLIFDKDISDLSKPEIKGRGYIRSGKDIVEFQSYWTEKEKDFMIKLNKEEIKQAEIEKEKEDKKKEYLKQQYKEVRKSEEKIAKIFIDNDQEEIREEVIETKIEDFKIEIPKEENLTVNNADKKIKLNLNKKNSDNIKINDAKPTKLKLNKK